jgi:hypothetical protein
VLCSVDSLWNSTPAPGGAHIVGVAEFSAPGRCFGEREWCDIGKHFLDNLLGEWKRYAPNMTHENVIAPRVYTPEDVRRERPNMIEGDYSAGSRIASQLGRGSSYNCDQEICTSRNSAPRCSRRTSSPSSCSRHPGWPNNAPRRS